MQGAVGFPVLLPAGQADPPVSGHTVCTEAAPGGWGGGGRGGGWYYFSWNRQSPKNGRGSGRITHTPSPRQVREWRGQSTGAPMWRQDPEALSSVERGAGQDFLLVQGREPSQERRRGIERRGRVEGTSVPVKVVGKGVGGGSRGAGERGWRGLGSLRWGPHGLSDAQLLCCVRLGLQGRDERRRVGGGC